MDAVAPGTDVAPYEAPALEALRSGACFCLAGLVQGLAHEPSGALAAAAPTVMVWGEFDGSHQPTDPGSIRDHVPDASVERFSDCGHFPDLEQPARFAARVRATVACQG